MSIDFTGRVAIVTGAGNGLGAVYARQLAALGAAVVVNDIGSNVDGTKDGTSPADAVVAEITAAGGRAVANSDSVADPEGAARLVQDAVSNFGRLDIVINNAGNRRNTPLEEVTAEDLEAVLAVHLKGSLYVTQAAFPVMQQHGYGRVLLTSSSAGLFGNAGQASYSAAKGGVFGLAQALALEGEPSGIRVNVLLPVAGTPRALAGRSAQVAAALAADGAAEVTQNDQDAELVAALVMYLVSEECTFTHETFASASGRYYSAFVATTPGWRRADGGVPSPDEIAAHIDVIRSRAGFHTPGSLGDDVADGQRQDARTPAQTVSAYFDRVRAKDADAVAELFTEDSSWAIPGRRITGSAALRDFYRETFDTSDPAPAPSAISVNGTTVTAQFQARNGNRRMDMVDVFTIDDSGLISTLRAYQGE